LGRALGMRHEFDICFPRERDHSFEAIQRKVMRESEKMVGQAMPACQTAIHPTAVPPVYKTLFAGTEGKAPSHFGARRKDALDQHVAGQMHMLMSVKVRWSSPVESQKFFMLCLKNVAELSSQPRVIKQKCILAGCEKTTDLIVIIAQPYRNRASRKSFV